MNYWCLCKNSPSLSIPSASIFPIDSIFWTSFSTTLTQNNFPNTNWLRRWFCWVARRRTNPGAPWTKHVPHSGPDSRPIHCCWRCCHSFWIRCNCELVDKVRRQKFGKEFQRNEFPPNIERSRELVSVSQTPPQSFQTCHFCGWFWCNRADKQSQPDVFRWRMEKTMKRFHWHFCVMIGHCWQVCCCVMRMVKMLLLMMKCLVWLSSSQCENCRCCCSCWPVTKWSFPCRGWYSLPLWWSM